MGEGSDPQTVVGAQTFSTLILKKDRNVILVHPMFNTSLSDRSL